MRKLIYALAALCVASSAWAAEVGDYSATDASNTGRWPENMAPSAVNNAGRANEGIIARWYKDTNGSLVSTGSANAYALAINSTDTVYDGQVLCFDANFANTGPATLNVTNSGGAAQGATNILKHNDTSLASGDIEAGQKVCVVYDGAAFQMLTQTAQANPTASIALTALATGTVGEVITWDASGNPATVSAGASGYVLTATSGAAPVFQSVDTGLSAASQAQMEAGTSNDVGVTPGTATYAPGAAKVWVVFDGTAGASITPNAYHNASGTITSSGTGKFHIPFDVSFTASTHYVVVGTAQQLTGDAAAIVSLEKDIAPTTTGVDIAVQNQAGSYVDSAIISITVFGSID